MAVFKYDVLPDAEEENKIVVPKMARNALVPHVYNPQRDAKGKVVGYQRIVHEPQQYPKVISRAATAEEIAERRADLPEEVWMDPDTDLIQITKTNQVKKHSAYEKWITRPVELVAESAEQEAEIKALWKKEAELKAATKKVA